MCRRDADTGEEVAENYEYEPGSDEEVVEPDHGGNDDGRDGNEEDEIEYELLVDEMDMQAVVTHPVLDEEILETEHSEVEDGDNGDEEEEPKPEDADDEMEVQAIAARAVDVDNWSSDSVGSDMHLTYAIHTGPRSPTSTTLPATNISADDIVVDIQARQIDCRHPLTVSVRCSRPQGHHLTATRHQ